MVSKIIIQQNKKKQEGLTILGIMMVSASIFVFIQDNVLYKVIGIVGTLFFGVCLFFISYRLLKPKEILIIDNNGFVDNSSLSSFGFIQWKYVDSLRIMSMLNQKFISVKMKDSYNPNISRTKKILTKFNTTFGEKMINITLNSSDVNINDVLLIMQEHLSEYRSN